MTAADSDEITFETVIKNEEIIAGGELTVMISYENKNLMSAKYDLFYDNNVFELIETRNYFPDGWGEDYKDNSKLKTTKDEEKYFSCAYSFTGAELSGDGVFYSEFTFKINKNMSRSAYMYFDNISVNLNNGGNPVEKKFDMVSVDLARIKIYKDENNIWKIIIASVSVIAAVSFAALLEYRRYKKSKEC